MTLQEMFNLLQRLGDIISIVAIPLIGLCLVCAIGYVLRISSRSNADNNHSDDNNHDNNTVASKDDIDEGSDFELKVDSNDDALSSTCKNESHVDTDSEHDNDNGDGDDVV